MHRAGQFRESEIAKILIFIKEVPTFKGESFVFSLLGFIVCLLVLRGV